MPLLLTLLLTAFADPYRLPDRPPALVPVWVDPLARLGDILPDA